MPPSSNSAQMIQRGYRFALRPTEAQTTLFAQAADQGRRVWNELVALLDWAEREQRFGRREALLHKYGRLLAGKALVGRAVSTAKRLMIEKGLPSLAAAIALDRNRRLQVARAYPHRTLAMHYAVERTRCNAGKKGLLISRKVVELIVRRFAEACGCWLAGKRGRPRFKTASNPVTLQWQVDPRCLCPVKTNEKMVDLAELVRWSCRRPARHLAAVEVVLHRSLPRGGKIKQLAISFTPTRTFVVLVIEAPLLTFARRVPLVPVGDVAGIDPGRRTAMSVSDPSGRVQITINPPLRRDAPFQRRRRRWLRAATREIRRANPDRFDAQGRWKKGCFGAVKTTAKLRSIRHKLAEDLRHLADVRRAVYHREANALLERFSAVGVGDWRGRGQATGQGPSRRAQNRKDHDNAVGEFVRLLTDKASRSLPPRRVLEINEAFTTRCCADCGAPTGPRGLKDLKVRVWTCTGCGQIHQRDFASARAIARRTLALTITAAGAQPAQPEPTAMPTRTPAAPVCPQAREGRPSTFPHAPAARKLVPAPERRSGVSAAKIPRDLPAVGVEEPCSPCSQPPNWLQPELPLGLPDTPPSTSRQRSRALPKVSCGCAVTVTRPTQP